MQDLLLYKLENDQAFTLNFSKNHKLIISTFNNKVLFTDNENGENWEGFDKEDIEGIRAAISKYEKQGYVLKY